MNFIWFAFLAMLCWGSAPIVDKLLLRSISPLAATMVRGLVVAIMMSGAVVFSGQLGELRSLNWKVFGLIAVSALLAGALGQWAFYMALKPGRAALVVPIVAAYPIVTAIFGITLLGESLSLLRGVGVLLVVAGVVLLKTG